MDKTADGIAKLNQKLQTIKSGKPKIFEYYWKVLFILVSGVMLLLAKKIYLFHTLEQFKDTKKGQPMNLIKYGIPIAFIYIAIDYAIHQSMDEWVNRNYLRQDKYKTQEIRRIKSRVIVRWAFNIFYYLPISIIGYFLIKETSAMPSFLGGHGSTYSLVHHRYLEEATFGMQIYYYVQFGKHLGRYFCHTFIQPQGSYYQYLLHHSLATFLIVFSYLMDMWVIGIFVLILHDFSDAFLALGRMYRQYNQRKKFFQIVTSLLAAVFWFGFRVITFSYCCVWAVWYQCIYDLNHLTQTQMYVLSLPYSFMAFMLSCLLIMHVYWTYYILESFLGTAVTKKLGHSYD